MKTAGCCTCTGGAERLKSCQIASNYEPVDAYARGKSFQYVRGTSPVGKSANRNFPIPYHPVNHLILPWASVLAPRSLPHSPPSTYFPWKCKFRVTDIVSQTGDISHRRRGREVDVRVRKDRSYTVNISRANFSISSPDVISMTTRSISRAR